MILNPTIVNLGADTSDATATAADVLSGKTAYGKDGKITGTIPSKGSADLSASGATVTVPAGHYPSQVSKSVATATQATPGISVNGPSGLITASATQSAGYVSGGTKSATHQLATQSGGTITPGTSQKLAVQSYRYTTGNVYVAGDSNLISTNIRKGTSIFGVSGSYSGGEPVLEDVEVESVPNAGYVTFTTTKRISKVCSISFFVESMDLYGYYTYLFTLQANGMLSVHTGKYNSKYAPNYFIGSVGGELNSGEVISGSTVTYGKGTSGWVSKIPQGSTVYGTICYIPA